VCAPEEAGAVDGRVEGTVGESEVDGMGRMAAPWPDRIERSCEAKY
jgi:hypothetical protein